MFIKYFRSSFIFAFLALVFSFFVGFYYTGLWTQGLAFLWTAAILSILEISLSFDNAIVNATVLKEMTPLWRHRFLTWGMLIAVFGMRFVFPVVIVSVAAQISPWTAIEWALFEPAKYAEQMLSSHLLVSAFGGSFLLLVALEFFYDENKETHWIGFIEKRLVRWGRLEALEILITLLTLLFLILFIPGPEKYSYLLAGVCGVCCFIAVKGLGEWLELSHEGTRDLQRASSGMFIYLEVLDASFSFDGVVGSFAITNNLLVIMAGLSIGAFFVRSLTILFVEKEVLNHFDYLEHGAFYAIAVLAILMLLDPFTHIPEWVTGLSGGLIIVMSFVWSLSNNRQKS